MRISFTVSYVFLSHWACAALYCPSRLDSEKKMVQPQRVYGFRVFFSISLIRERDDSCSTKKNDAYICVRVCVCEDCVWPLRVGLDLIEITSVIFKPVHCVFPFLNNTFYCWQLLRLYKTHTEKSTKYLKSLFCAFLPCCN